MSKLALDHPQICVLNKPTQVASVTDAETLLPPGIHARLLDLPEHGLLHRLDTGTSGCLAYARDLSTYEFLRAAFHSGHPELKKHYEAIVVCPVQGTFLSQTPPIAIDFPIARIQKTAKRMKVLLKSSHTVGIRGNPMPALTTILSAQEMDTEKTLGFCFEGKSESPSPFKLFRLRIQIQTGVMHQIRAHLSACGIGILGDPLYKLSPEIREIRSLFPENFPRFYLHAARLTLPLPSGEIITAEAPWDPVAEIRSLENPAKSSKLGRKNE